MTQCTHLGQIQKVTPSADGCEDCLKIGDTWVHLRLCMICGHVACCDQSKTPAPHFTLPRSTTATPSAVDSCCTASKTPEADPTSFMLTLVRINRNSCPTLATVTAQ